MTTLDVLSSKRKPEPSAEESAAKELVRLAREQGLSLTGPDRLLKQFTKSVLECRSCSMGCEPVLVVGHPCDWSHTGSPESGRPR